MINAEDIASQSNVVFSTASMTEKFISIHVRCNLYGAIFPYSCAGSAVKFQPIVPVMPWFHVQLLHAFFAGSYVGIKRAIIAACCMQ